MNALEWGKHLETQFLERGRRAGNPDTCFSSTWEAGLGLAKDSSLWVSKPVLPLKELGVSSALALCVTIKKKTTTKGTRRKYSKAHYKLGKAMKWNKVKPFPSLSFRNSSRPTVLDAGLECVTPASQPYICLGDPPGYNSSQPQLPPPLQL